MPRLTEDAAAALLRALGARFRDFECAYRVEELNSRSWASVTFTGARHRVALSLEGDGAAAAADAFLADMSEAEFDLRGHILADIALAGDERDAAGGRVRLSLEALTVEDV